MTPIPPDQCARCGAPIDATDSIQLADGATCLSCVDEEGATHARLLARRRHLRQVVAGSTVSILCFFLAQTGLSAPWSSAVGLLGVLALLVAARAFWRNAQLS